MKVNVLPVIEALFNKYNNKNANFYFLIQLLGHRKDINDRRRTFYTDIITHNNFGVTSEKLSTAITHEVKDTQEYNNFVAKLAEWYTRTEMIIFNISIINLFFMKNAAFVFDSNGYSP
jgi:hypothetical protein